MSIFWNSHLPIYREKDRCLPPRDLMKKISKHTQITKFTPHFVFYGSVSDLIFIFFIFPFTNIKWNMEAGFDFHLFYLPLSPPRFSKILRKHYGSHGSPGDGSLLVELLWRLDLWASMRSFNGDFSPRRCSGRQRRRSEKRRHPLGNKPWKKELHHQDEPWIRSLGMEWNKMSCVDWQLAWIAS